MSKRKCNQLKSDPRRSKGQVLLVTVLLLGGAAVAASAIAGYLMLLSIRQSSDAGNSAKAIFAADTGIEWNLYCRFKDPKYESDNDFKCAFAPPSCDGKGTPYELCNGATLRVYPTQNSTKSIGISNNFYRALQISF